MATIAGAMERKVWLKAFKRVLYPNLYVLLTGGPGIGKTDALRGTIRFWDELPALHVAPSSVTRASLIDDLADAERTVLRPGDVVPFTKFNSLAIGATEFGTFLIAYEGEFLSTLNDLYDCVRYKERKRHMNKGVPIEIPHPQLNLIAGTTPAWLSSTLPENAWNEGFASRLMLIYSGDRVRIDPFAESASDSNLETAMIHDLRDIHAMFGQMEFEPEVVTLFRNWYMEGCPPVPEHPKLEDYLPRRHIHFLKLCMVMSAQRAPDYVIRVEDYQRAMDLLLEAEVYMPDTFKAMKSSSDGNVIDECFAFIWQDYVKTEKPMAEHRIVHFLQQRVPAHSVMKILELMTSSGIIDIVNTAGERGRSMYRPAPRAQHNS